MAIVELKVSFPEKLLDILETKILANTLPSEAKKLRDLKLEKVEIKRNRIENKNLRYRELISFDPNDEMIENSLLIDKELDQKEKLLDEKILIIIESSATQLDTVLSRLSNK